MSSNKRRRHPAPALPDAEDIALFRQAVEGVHRLHTDRILLETPPPRAWPVQREADDRSVLAESIRGPLSTDLRLEGGEEPSFLRAGLITDMVITQVPLLIGAGKPLFGALPHDIDLQLVSSRSFPSGLVQSCYRVAR